MIDSLSTRQDLLVPTCTFCYVTDNCHPTADYLALMTDERRAAPVGSQGTRIGNVLLLIEIAPIVVGHVLLIPLRHTLATAALPPEELDEFNQVCRCLGQQISERAGYESYIAFEHGTGKPSSQLPHRVKCGPTEHAHMHIMPNVWGTRILDDVVAHAALAGYSYFRGAHANHSKLLWALNHEMSTYHSFLTGSRNGEEYVLFLPPNGALPSQYFRRFLTVKGQQCNVLDINDFRLDWRDQVLLDSTTPDDIRATLNIVNLMEASSLTSCSVAIRKVV